jgi:two-component system LytT family response regulator
VLEKIKEKNFEVVFVTAFDQYAIKAFEFSALGYLMKPIRLNELKQIVSTIKEKSEKLKASSPNRLKVLVENYGDDHKIHKLVISNMEGFKVVSIEEIVRLEGDRNYTDFILLDGKKVTSTKTLGEYQELLNDFGFFRVHQSTIVNLRHVMGYNRNERLVELVDGAKIVMSRHRKNEFIEKFI